MAGGGEDILVPVQVHVEEQHVPRPIGGLDPGVAADLRERAVAAVSEQGVALPLRTVVDAADQLGQRRVSGDLALTPGPEPQHVADQNVDVAIAIHVGKVDRHRRVAGVADREARHGAEGPRAVVQPEHVGILEVVAHVQIRRAVPIDVGELGGQAEVLRRGGERLAVLVAEPARGPRDEREMPLAVVQIEGVRIGPLLHRHEVVLGPIHHAVVLAELGNDLPVSVAHLMDHAIERSLLRRIDVHRRAGLVIGDVEIEMPVAIYVGQRHRHAAGGRAEPGLLRPLGEDAVAVVHEERDASGERADEQIEVAVTVDVGEHGTRGMATGQRDAGSGRDVFEVKVAEVAVQGVRALVARQVDVGEAVAVHVAQRDAAALGQVAVPQGTVDGDGVGEANSGPRG